MAKAESTRRGKPETRSNYERARDGFKAQKGARRVAERLDPTGCPFVKSYDTKTGAPNVCGQPMLLRKSYVGKDGFKFEGICMTGDKDHHILRYGFFTTDETAIPTVQLDEED